MKNKILCFQLQRDDMKVMDKGLEKYPDFESINIPGLKLSDVKALEEAVEFFIYVDESTDRKALELLLKQGHARKSNIILKNKDFDLLMLCFRYRVHSVFEKKLEAAELDRVLIQIDLLNNEKADHLPVGAVIELFSSPLKVKSDYGIYDYLANYFRKFDSIQSFGLVRTEGETKNLLGGNLGSTIMKEINFPDVKKNYIGSMSGMKINDKDWTILPIYHQDNDTLWIVIDVLDHSKNYILNKLFFKFLENVQIYRRNKEKEKSLTALATTDDVTGLYNQRKLSQDLARAVEYHEKNHENFSIMFIDVDHFKTVNDNYGHIIGSKLLQDIGDELSLILRASDDIYRYGGDEFVVIMPSVTIKTVHEIATRVLMKIKNKKFKTDGGKEFQLSVSIGIAEYPTDATSAIEIIRFADEMMYQSKKSGRGKVFHIKEVENVDVGSK